MRTVVSWSTGKDSAWVLHLLRSHRDVELVGLLTTITAPFRRVTMHGVRQKLLRAQARAAGLALTEVALPYPCSQEDYDARMAAAVAGLRQQGVEAIAFGDISLDQVRQYRESRLQGTGLRPLFPLWGRDTRALTREMLGAGLRARITCVDPARLPESLVGKPFDLDLVARLCPQVDPGGEQGEFHTFVHAGPMFHHPIEIAVGQTVTRDGFVFADLLEV